MHHETYIFTLLLLLTTFTPDYCLGKTNMAESTDSFTTLVFNRASSPIPYRIPALARPKGYTAAACDYAIANLMWGGNNETAVEIDVVMKRSTDYGRTWSSRSCGLWQTRMPSIPSERLMATPASCRPHIRQRAVTLCCWQDQLPRCHTP